MISTQPVHTISKKGGGYCIQFKLAKQFILIVSIIWFYKMKDVINYRGIVNPSSTSNPGKCIMHFLKLRTRSIHLHSEIDNFFHQLKRRIRVEKLTLGM
jgi:hypothetical protein